jgi:hypothetical protein
MRIIAMTVAAALATASAVEYTDGQIVTFATGRQEAGVVLPEFNVLVIWTSKSAPTGPIYGISILPYGSVLSTKPLKGKSPPNSYPVQGALFEPDTEDVLASDQAAALLTTVGLKGEPAEQATQARTRLAAIKAAAMKLIKP